MDPWRELELDDWFDTYLPGEDVPDDLRWNAFDVDLASERTMCAGLKKRLQDAIATVGSSDWVARSPDCPQCHPRAGDVPWICPELAIFRVPAVRYDSMEVPVQVKHETVARTTASSHGTNSPPSSSTPSHSLPPVTSISHSDSSIYMTTPSETDPLEHYSHMMDYVAELCDRQHRLFVFMLSFVNDRARLIRFDRAGASMSVEFAYALHPEIIGKFLYRLSRQDRAGRGYDPTVIPASEADVKLFRSLHTRYVPDSAVGRALSDAVTDVPGGWPICKLTVEGPFTQDANRAVLPSDPVERREFLIGKPMSARRALYGRGTKAYAAYDIATGKIVVIKDSWRPSSSSSSSSETRIRTEYDTYLLLNSAERPAGQPFLIPTLLGGGDVVWNGVAQDTPTSAGRDSDRLLTARTHFRLVLKEVCRPLEDLTNSLELVVVVLCAIDAHSVAWLSARILHRDVSTGNILILDEDPEGLPNPRTAKGLLADWDHARTQEESDNPVPSGHNTRSGTWPFISARLQHTGPEQRHELSDDLESFVHVLNYCALKYLPNELSDDGDMLASFIFRVYDRVRYSDGLYKGSTEKLKLLVQNKPFVELRPREQQPLQCLLDALSGLCYRHYHHIQFPPPQPPHIAALSQEKMSVHRGRFSHMHISVRVSAAAKAGPEVDRGESLATGPATTATPALPPPEPSKSPLNSHDAIARAFLHTLEPPTSKHPAYGLGWPAADKLKRV